MKKISSQIVFCFCIILSGCTSSHLITTWKAQHFSRVNYNNILVVGIIKNENDSLRREIEKHFVIEMEGLGYHAVSALQEFGPKGLANLGEEETYIKFCDMLFKKCGKKKLLKGTKIKTQNNLKHFSSKVDLFRHCRSRAEIFWFWNGILIALIKNIKLNTKDIFLYSYSYLHKTSIN